MKRIMFSVYFGISVFVLSAAEKTHTVKPGESLYSIARMYNVSVNDLKRLNAPLASNPTIRAGQKIVVTASATKVAPTNNDLQLNNAKAAPANVHVVAKGETLFAICRKYGVSAVDVKNWNELASLNLRPGQKLIVSKTNSSSAFKPASVPGTPDTPYREEDVRPRSNISEASANAVIEQDKMMLKPQTNSEVPKPAITIAGLRTTSSNAADYPVIFNQYSSHGYKIKKNKGAANFLEDATIGNQNLAFYNDAETGSVIRVTNLMNHKTVFVKVIGKVPPMDASKEVAVKLSSKAAKDLGAIDAKFLVEVASFGDN